MSLCTYVYYERTFVSLPKPRVAINLTAGRPTLLCSHCTCHYSLVPVQHQALAGPRAGGQTGPVAGDSAPVQWGGLATFTALCLSFGARPSKAGYGLSAAVPRIAHGW